MNFCIITKHANDGLKLQSYIITESQATSISCNFIEYYSRNLGIVLKLKKNRGLSLSMKACETGNRKIRNTKLNVSQR